MNITKVLRKNIGTIIAALGFILLCIMTFGDLGELVTDAYWQNVKDNITAISFMSVGLTLVQVAIKQGLAEQALQRGLNSEKAQEAYEAHRAIVKDNTERLIYLPYFLQIYNKRHTMLRRREFMINNGYLSEQTLLQSGDKKLIRQYKRIIIHITAASIKWSTTEIIYDKNGRIITLDEYRTRRMFSSVITSMFGMIGVTFLAGGLFFSPSAEPFWQKLVRLSTYIVAIAVTSIFSVVKEYEKGAFGIPNELNEINQIWAEFSQWEIPTQILDEVAKLNTLEVIDERSERTDECRADLSGEQTTGEDI